MQTIFTLPETPVELSEANQGLVTSRSFLIEAPTADFPYNDELANTDQLLDTLYSLTEGPLQPMCTEIYNLTTFEVR